MRLFDFIKKKKSGEVKEKVKTPEQKINSDRVVLRHKNRIKNLLEEAESLSNELVTLEGNETIAESKRSKASDTIIHRLTLIKYEIGIREDLISWL